MSNVLFKRGLQQTLNNLNNFAEGSFYLTTDSGRLYYANGTTKQDLLDLNQYIRSISSVEFQALKQTDVEYGDFYYISDKNILCIYTGADATGRLQWTQLNVDTTLVQSSENTTVSDVTGGVQVKSVVEDTRFDGANSSTGTFTLKGTGVAEITHNGNVITVNVPVPVDTNYVLSTASVATGGAELVLTSTVNDKDVQKVTFKEGGIVDIKSDTNGEITITVDQTDVGASAAFDAEGTLTITPTSSTGTTSSSATVAPIVRVGGNATPANNTPVKFANGIADLPVYTITEVNEKIADAVKVADAMVYQGIATEAMLTSTSAKYNKGDTFKAGNDLDGKKINGQDVRTGDLIISNSKDGTVANAIDWQVIPSGNDQFIEVEGLTNGIVVKDNGSVLGSINLTNTDDSIDITSTGDAEKVVTITHAAPLTGTAKTIADADSTTTQTESNTLIIPAVTGISTDKNGHITDITLKKYQVVDTHVVVEKNLLGLETTAVENGQSTAAVDLTIKTSDTSSATTTINLVSDSLAFTGTKVTDGDQITTNINLVWGSF